MEPSHPITTLRYTNSLYTLEQLRVLSTRIHCTVHTVRRVALQFDCNTLTTIDIIFLHAKYVIYLRAHTHIVWCIMLCRSNFPLVLLESYDYCVYNSSSRSPMRSDINAIFVHIFFLRLKATT